MRCDCGYDFDTGKNDAEGGRHAVRVVAPTASLLDVGLSNTLAAEDDFENAYRLLLDPPRFTQKFRLLIISLVLFAWLWIIQGGGSLIDLAILVSIILVHELGHAAGMQLFGYRDVRILFIPLFGAATAGRKPGVPQWQEAIVLLLGPLPGIIAGCVIGFTDGPLWLHSAALWLLGVNALNLLPLEPLDGGKLFQVLVFSRNRHLEVAFRVATALILVAAALYFHDWVLTAVGVLMLLTVRAHRRMLAAAQALRPLGLPADPAALNESQGRLLFRAVWDYLPARHRNLWRGKLKSQAVAMKQLLECATVVPPSALPTVATLGAWAAGLAIAVAGFVGLNQHRPAQWQRYTHTSPTFSLDMPATPEEGMQDGVKYVFAVHGQAGYTVSWVDLPDPAAWLASARANRASKPEVMHDAALPADEFAIATSRSVKHEKLIITEAVGYVLVAEPGDTPDARRFFDSFSAR